MIRFRTALLLALFAVTGNLLAAGLPIVLSSQVRLQLQEGGLRAQVVLETHAAKGPSRPFPTVSGAGALLSWSAAPAGRFALANPTQSAPGAPAFRQQTDGRGQLTIELWQPLSPSQTEVVLRLPPTPNGAWRFEGLPEEGSLHFGEQVSKPTVATGGFEGQIPGDGMLWLSWGGQARGTEVGYLESSDLELKVEAEEVRFRARLRGYQPTRALSIRWAPEMRLDGEPLASSMRTRREDGVDVHGLEKDWFDEVFEGTVEFQNGDTTIRLPVVHGLGRPARGELRIVPVVARRLRLLAEAEVLRTWSIEGIEEGVQRLQLRPSAGLLPIRLRSSGRVPKTAETVRIPRYSAQTVPSQSDDFLLSSEIEVRINQPGILALGFPSAMRILSMKFGAEDLQASGDPFPAAVKAGYLSPPLEVRRPGVLRLRVDHFAPTEIPASGPWSVRLPQVLSVNERTGETGIVAAASVERLQWRGRLPAAYAMVRRVGGPTLRPGRRPFPLRWMDASFHGTKVVLKEAGVVVAFGLALLLGLYAALFLRPPNKQSVYVLAFGIAVFGLLYNLMQAAEAAPRAGLRPAGSSGGMMFPLAETLHHQTQRISEMLSTSRGAPYSGGGGGAPGAPAPAGLRPRMPMLSSPATPGDLPAGHTPGDGHAHAHILRPDTSGAPTGVPIAEPIPDDWEFTELVTTAGPPAPLVQLLVVSSRMPYLAGMALALLVLAAVGLAFLKGGVLPAVLLTAGAGLMLPLDLCFGRDASGGLGLILTILLAVTLHRVVLEGLTMWEKLRDELENRRLQALSRSGKPSGRDTGGGQFSGAKLQKNEVSYEDVFRDDEGITFIMGEG